MLINRNIVALFALPFMASATASELSIGAGAAYNESPYRGYNENTKAIPLISYEGDTFYVRQTTLGFILSQSEKNELFEFVRTANGMFLKIALAGISGYGILGNKTGNQRFIFWWSVAD